MKRFFKTISATRNIVLLAVLLGIIGAMIITVKRMNRDPVFILPELREETAARRYGPNNAFPELKKVAIPLQENIALGLSFVLPEGASIAGFYGVIDNISARREQVLEESRQALAREKQSGDGRRQSFNPEEHARRKISKEVDEAISVIRAIVNHKTDYLAIPPKTIAYYFDPRVDVFITRICNYLLMFSWQGSFEATVDWSTDAIRLARLADQEIRFWDEFPSLEKKALETMMDSARKSQNPAELEYLQNALEQLGPPCPEPRKMLENWWRFLDDSLAWPKLDSKTEPFKNVDLGERINMGIVQLRLQSRIKKIIREKEMWYALIEERPEQVYKALDRELRKTWKLPYRDQFNDASQMIGFVNKMAESRSVYYATLQAVALLRYRMAEGDYPDDLNTLVPRYLLELPNDPFAEEPFCYRKTETGCLLYSRSFNARDDNGNPGHDTAIIALNGEAEPLSR
jgi:hypothetical protein